MSFTRRLVSASLAIATCLAAPLAAKPAAAPAANAARPALWKLADADTTIYLFGTIHALPDGIDWFRGPVADAFNASGTLVTEVATIDPMAVQSVVLRTAILPPGQKLSAMLTPADREKLTAALGGFKLPPAAFDRFEPWYAAVTLSTLPLLKAGYNPANGVDVQLGAKAKEAKRPQEGLETIDYQLGLFDSLPQKLQVKYLHEVLTQLPKMDDELNKLVVSWRTGNADKLAAQINSGETDPQVMKTLLTDRNVNWANWIKTRMDKPGTVFIAVGAGHLAGNKSVQKLLAAKGIKAVRVQ